MLTFSDFISYVKSDLYRYTGKINLSLFMKNILLNPGFKFTFFLRLTLYFSKRKINPLFLFSRLILNKYKFKYGYDISYKTQMDKGFFIGHFGGIVINHKSKIGKNCTISQGVTIGKVNRGSKEGVPSIGNEVYIGPGAKVIGNIQIGSNVAIGANCVVTNDVPDNSVVVGIPGKVISKQGSIGYVNNIDYKL